MAKTKSRYLIIFLLVLTLLWQILLWQSIMFNDRLPDLHGLFTSPFIFILYLLFGLSFFIFLGYEKKLVNWLFSSLAYSLLALVLYGMIDFSRTLFQTMDFFNTKTLEVFTRAYPGLITFVLIAYVIDLSRDHAMESK